MTLSVGDVVSVRRAADRIMHLQVRVIGPGWFVGHQPHNYICHRARDEDVISIIEWSR